MLRWFLICLLLKVQRFVDDALKDIFDACVIERPRIVLANLFQHLAFAYRVAERCFDARLFSADRESDTGPLIKQPQHLAVDTINFRSRAFDLRFIGHSNILNEKGHYLRKIMAYRKTDLLQAYSR